ncbi:MAG TPA: ISKra4 family transposase [Ktedonobacterales bacterium]|nr:ISKra4 family transposase [Ktedonobacterales bacterium]
MQEDLVHLSTWMPFERAAKELAHFTRVEVSETSVRHHTEVAGAAYVALQAEELERLQRERPVGPTGPEVLQVSADGAMVPLRGGEWAEVKTVAVGRVELVTNREGVPEAHARELGYFSRLADAETFTHAAWVELHRAGIATATTVCGVMDGADWEQTFLDVHRADAIRILDFPHAVEYLTRAAQLTWGQTATAAESWLQEQAHTLKHDEHGAAKVLVALAHLPTERAVDPGAARQARETALNYLTKRLDQIQYARFQAQGLPIGSGSVESANKLVVEARLKGSGMHWARAHVNAVVALRTIACSDRWSEAWPQIELHLRQQIRHTRRQRQRVRRATLAATCTPPPMPTAEPSTPHPSGPRHSPSIVNGHPTALHPWKKPAYLAARRRALNARPKS